MCGLDRNELMLTSNIKFKSDHIPSLYHGTCDVVPSYCGSASYGGAPVRVDGCDRRKAEIEL